MQKFTDAYLEICTRIGTKMPYIKWVDLWHNQVNFLDEEHPFPTPAIFLGFRTQKQDETGQKAVDKIWQIDMYLFYETFSDTFKGSHNQASAIDFLKALDDMTKYFHAWNGSHLGSLSDLGTRPVETGGSGNLYVRSFSCNLRDYAATPAEDYASEPEVAENRSLFTP